MENTRDRKVQHWITGLMALVFALMGIGTGGNAGADYLRFEFNDGNVLPSAQGALYWPPEGWPYRISELNAYAVSGGFLHQTTLPYSATGGYLVPNIADHNFDIVVEWRMRISSYVGGGGGCSVGVVDSTAPNWRVWYLNITPDGIFDTYTGNGYLVNTSAEFHSFRLVVPAGQTGYLVYVDGQLAFSQDSESCSTTGMEDHFFQPGCVFWGDQSTAPGASADWDYVRITAKPLAPLVNQPPKCTLIAEPPLLAADGVKASTLALTYLDSAGSPVVGHTIRFYSDRGGKDTFSSATAVTDGDGKASVTVTSLTPGVSTYTCRDETDGNQQLPCSAQVTFTSPGGGPKFTVAATAGEGMCFPQYVPFANRVAVTVLDWLGSPGTVRFELNGVAVDVSAPQGTAERTFDMGSDLRYEFPRMWSTLRVYAINGEGAVSEPYELHWLGFQLPPSLSFPLWAAGLLPRATLSREDTLEVSFAVTWPHEKTLGAARVPAPLPLMSNTVWGSEVARSEFAVTVSLSRIAYPSTDLQGSARVSFGPDYTHQWNRFGTPPKQKLSINSLQVEAAVRPYAEFQFSPAMSLQELGLEMAFKATIETPDLLPMIAAALPAAATLTPWFEVFGRFVLPDATGTIRLTDTNGYWEIEPAALDVGVSGAVVASFKRSAKSCIDAEMEVGLKPGFALEFPGNDVNAYHFAGCRLLAQVTLDLFLQGHVTVKLGFFETSIDLPSLRSHFAYPAASDKRGLGREGPDRRVAGWHAPSRPYLSSREPYHRQSTSPVRHPFQPWLDASSTDGNARTLASGEWDVAELKLVENVNNVASPSLAYLDGNAVIVYVYDRPSLPAHQATEIRMLRQTATGWADVDVTNDTALDSQPFVAVSPEGKLVAVWTRMENVQETDDPATRYSKAEIAWSVWDPVSQTWSAVATVTSDALLDLNPRLTIGRDGVMYLTWLKSPDNVFPSDFSTRQLPHTNLWIARWDGSNFVSPEQAIAGVDTTEHVAFAVASSGEGVAVWSKDRDGDAASDDPAVYFSRYAGGTWTAPERVDAADVQPQTTPSLTFTTSDVATLFYVRSGLPNVAQEDHTEENLVASTLLGGAWSAPLFVARSGNMAHLEVLATPDGKAAAIWTASSTETADIWSTVFDPATATFSLPVPLTKDQGDERQLSAAWDPAGNPSAAYLKRRLEEQEREVEDDQGNKHTVTVLTGVANDMYILIHAPKPDLAVSDADLTVTPPAAGPGESATLSLGLRNLRGLAASGVQVRFMDRTPDGDTAIATVTTDPAVVVGGGSATASTTWVVPTDGKPHTVVAVVDPDNTVVETDETNNEASYALVPPDLAAGKPYAKEYLPDGSVKLVLPIRNISAVTFNSPVEWKLWEGEAGSGAILGAGTTSAPDPGQEQLLEVVWKPMDSTPSEAMMTLVVDPDSKLADGDRSNNTASGVIALRPDLMLNPYDGTFKWNADGTGTVEVTLQNVGWCTAENVLVTVFSGPPADPGVVALGSATVDSLASYASSRLSIAVTPTGDTREVYVVANPAGVIAEVRRDNNLVILTCPSRTQTTAYTIDRTGTVTELIALRGYLRRKSDNAWLDGKTIRFSVDGTEVGTAVTGATGSSGRADLNWIVTEGPATRTITAEFAGDTTYLPSSATASLTAQCWTTKMVGFDRTARIAGTTELKARLLRSDNVPLYNRMINFYVDGTFVIARPTSTQGYASYPYFHVPDGAGAGTRTILGEWPGNGGYLPSSCTNTLNVLKATPYIWVMPRSVPKGGIARFYAYFRRLPDYQKQAGKTLSFTIDGTWIVDVVTLSGLEAGIARYNYTTVESVGDHTLRAEFAGDAWVDAGYGEALLRIY